MRPASHHKRSPSEHIDEDFSSSSNGGEEYTSTHFDEFSSREGKGCFLESEETWEITSIGGMNYTILPR